MKLMSRRCLLAVALGALLVPAAALASTTVDPSTAARACAEGRAIRTRLTGADADYLGRFVPCVLHQERAQLGLSYTQTPALSRMMRSALKAVSKLPYENQEPYRLKAVDRVTIRLAKEIVAKTCPPGSVAAWNISFGETLGAATPLAFATDAAGWFKRGLPATASRAVFGVAWQHGLVFHGGNPNGAAFGAIVINCR